MELQTPKPKPVSPYGHQAPVLTVAEVGNLDGMPLQPFEQAQLNRLITQLNATPIRVQQAFYRHINGIG